MVAVPADTLLPHTQPPRPLIDVRNPVTLEPLAQVPIASLEDVRAAVGRARAAQPVWAATPPAARGDILRRWADLLWVNTARVVDAIRAETGKAEPMALAEIVWLDQMIGYYAGAAPGLLRPERRRSLIPFVVKTWVHHHPLGVVGHIGPWNLPLALSWADMVPALMAGNAVVVKPSEFTPLSAALGLELLREAGLPHDVAQIVQGDGRTGAALVDEVDMISFTGSTATRRGVAVRAAERLIPATLELGGNDALIVLEDADLDLAASGALAGGLNLAGQACIAIERVYVVDAVYNDFVARLEHYARQVRVGNEPGFNVHVGSLVREAELERTEQHITDAITQGAQVLVGGERLPSLGPRFFMPTVLLNVTHEMAVMREETFGPVLPVMRVADAAEAVRWANDSDYGLSATIYTSDLARGRRLAAQLVTGDVSVNRPWVNIANPYAPMGGTKHSGLGRRNGPEGLLRFTWSQTITTDNMLGRAPSLNILDETTYEQVRLVRRLRRWLPWL